MRNYFDNSFQVIPAIYPTRKSY